MTTKRLICCSSALFTILYVQPSAALVGQRLEPPVSSQQASAYVPKLAFDVASVHEAKVAAQYTMSGNLDPHRSLLRLENIDLLNLLGMAYDLDPYQIEGLPKRTFAGLFTIQAKSDLRADEVLEHLSDREATLEKEHMLQLLLSERFHLQVHWEQRQGQTYVLEVSRPGRLQEHISGSQPSVEDLALWEGKPIPRIYQQNHGNGFELIGHGASVTDIADALAGQLGRPVIDKTGLLGSYDFTLAYRGISANDPRADGDDSILPLEKAIHEFMGLKLAPARGSVKVLVIDHIESPDKN